MFKSIGGKSIEIQGLICHLPPEGCVFNQFTGEIEHRGIYKRSEQTSEQYWEVPLKPRNVKNRMKKERQKRIKDGVTLDLELQKYREQEWDRTTNGFWFYNKGVATYITGEHYFFLAHWNINGARPEFRIPNMEWHYFWECCWYDPDSYGMVEVTQRRDGKSVRAGKTIWYRTSRNFYKNSGIQSKADKDAARLFTLQVAAPLKELEPMWIPTLDSDKGFPPKRIISFNKKYSQSKEEETLAIDAPELSSEIDYRASGEAAYDGDRLYVYISDEAGKVENASIYERHTKVKPALAEGHRIIGKSIYTTTVEDIGDFDKYDEGNFQRLWDESDHLNKNEATNRTLSGLYRYFLPAYRADRFDKYGFPDEEKNKTFLMAEREARNDNPTDKASFIRKFPFVIEEAFWTPGDECIYDVIRIEQQKENLRPFSERDLFIRGDLSWVGGVRKSAVMFTPSKKGKWKVLKDWDIVKESQRHNSTVDIDEECRPLKKATRIIGVDPIDHKIINKGRGSNAAAYVFFGQDPDYPTLQDTPVAQLVYRPKDIDEFNENITMMAFLTGAICIIENQKQLLLHHLEKTGFKKFIHWYGQHTPGVHANPTTHQALADSTDIYIKNKINNVKFVEILNDWSKFTLKKTTKFDNAMAIGWALLVMYKYQVINTYTTKEVKKTILKASNFY